MNVTITYSGISADIYKVTGLHGKKAGDVEKIAGTSDEDDLLKRFFRDSSGALLSATGKYGTISSTSDTSITYSLNLPTSFPSNMTTSIEELMKSFTTNYIISRWFEVVQDQQNMQFYLLKCQEFQNALAINLNKRTKQTIS